MFGKSIRFQKVNKKISNKLIYILKNNQKDLLVGVINLAKLINKKKFIILLQFQDFIWDIKTKIIKKFGNL